MTEIVVIFNNRKRLQLGKVLTTVYWRVFFILVLVVRPLFTTTLRFPAQFCPLFAARTLSQTTSPHSALIFPCESKIKAPLPSPLPSSWTSNTYLLPPWPTSPSNFTNVSSSLAQTRMTLWLRELGCLVARQLTPIRSHFTSTLCRGSNMRQMTKKQGKFPILPQIKTRSLVCQAVSDPISSYGSTVRLQWCHGMRSYFLYDCLPWKGSR